MKPMEVDYIATKAWQAIYEGNATDQKAMVDNFMRKYDKNIYDAEQFDVGQITADRLREECTNARASAGGLDQWLLEDMALLSQHAYYFLAEFSFERVGSKLLQEPGARQLDCTVRMVEVVSLVVKIPRMSCDTI